MNQIMMRLCALSFTLALPFVLHLAGMSLWLNQICISLSAPVIDSCDRVIAFVSECFQKLFCL